jgi:primase-polymerase (primpol)-like protein
MLAYFARGNKSVSQAPPLRPSPVATTFDNIPAELLTLRQWVGWKFHRHDDRWTKVPINPHTWRKASVTNPQAWGSFQEALEAVQRFELDGIGFVFSEGDPYAGIDLDNAILESSPGEALLKDWAAVICGHLDSYAEISPSGKGVKLIVRGTLPKGRGRRSKFEDGAVELYCKSRFFTLTGWLLPGFTSVINPRQGENDALLGQLAQHKGRGAEAPVWDGEVWNTGLTDEQVIHWALKAKNVWKFRRLFYDGDTSDYKSESEADLALASMIAFYTGPDPEQIKRVFDRSSLGIREKWVEREDYRALTIERALDGMTSFFGKGRCT